MRNPLAFLALLPSLLFAASSIWDGTANTTWYNASETEFTITTSEQLAGLAELVNSGTSMDGKTIKLGNDIVLNETADWENWATSNEGLNQWTPIGTDYSNCFRGTFDGDGYAVSGVYTNTSSNYQGLFGYSTGTIKNLGVVASYIKGGSYSYVGGLVGYNYGGTISNSYATGNVEGTAPVGGLVGQNYYNATISNSYATGNVKGTGNVGGLVGHNNYNVTISNSYATGNVEGTNDVGGLTGCNQEGAISNSYATGNVSGTEYFVGGLAGRNISATISNSYATGNVEGIGNFIGGLVGSNQGKGAIINSYAIGNVSGTEYLYFVGGLVGENINTTTNSYYNTETSGQSDVGKGQGKTTEQMQSKSSYIDWNFDVVWEIDSKFNNGIPYLQWQNTMKLVQVEPIEPQLYTGSQIKPRPIVKAPDGKTELIPGTDFDYYYDENIHVASGGIVYIVSKTDAYYGTKIVNFIIKTAKTVDVYWTPECGKTYEYNGKPQGPTPYTLDTAKYKVTAAKETNAAIGIVAIATLETQEEDVVLRNDACPYTIAPKPLAVSWTPDSVFTYNKMTQAPMPSVSDTSIKLLRHNAHAVAGKYKNEDAASAEIEDQEQARNYTLTNRTKNYEILKKNLNPYFTPVLPPSDFNPRTDALWVPYEVFKDSVALLNVLSTLIDYDGFATDTLSKESDNATVLKGSPKITLRYTEPSTLQRRVETSQKATATISTEEMSADNYALTRPAIVILATIEEDDAAAKIYCQLGNACAMFSEAVCSAISGLAVEKCDVKVACVINSVCVENTPVEECTSIGGDAYSSCYQVPALRTQLSGGTFRVWQTASGVVNVDLGYMPAVPAKLQIYDLKGNMVAAEQVNTRFANVKVGVPSGVYLFRTGGKVLKMAVL